MKNEIAVLGGGCFWCTEAVCQRLRGVISVMPGYAGGHTKAPNYESVSMGKTGHAEVIQVEFDPSQISFRDILTVFFGTHDPTTMNRQGADVGTQYRSIILYTSAAQKAEAEKVIAEINASSKMGAPIVTEVKPLDVFYPAEKYHQDYYKNNPAQAYCQVVINPKLQKLKEKFSKLLKDKG
ncbi:MAG: peptide-methionine (S)-S-oxide reductase [Candidatus Abawacabacteria bacterium RBG_16_42_10]|uniref:Peptide methionine sulfoxide reductase MsrA n=1 Tax=Candidatus Abawacabacteria bacterium RBG_16_42_10 TaxID=1817814 RepID=A0A1F4XMA2_9BACT|nr:MAG: peptide-methionine (S)-S-oxide reductase [Candidatus Abawacabacteria bacterium RBG_16_42_10]